MLAGLFLALSCPTHADDAVPVPPPLLEFVKRPVQHDAVIDSMSRAWSQIVGACDSVSIADTRITLAGPITFKTDGTPAAGQWMESTEVSGCGTKRRLNVLTVVAPDGRLMHVATLPGDTIADPTLQRDSLYSVLAAAAPVVPEDCADTHLTDTKFVGFDGPPAKDTATGRPARPWHEQWTVVGCGKAALVTLHYAPDGDRMSIRAVPNETKSIKVK